MFLRALLCLPMVLITCDSALSQRLDFEMSQVGYLFRSGQKLAYMAEIRSTNGNRKDVWTGVIGFATKRPMPMRSDGSGYGSATISAFGTFEAHSDPGIGKMKRSPEGDRSMPDEIVFSPSGYKSSKGDNPKLPADMGLRYSFTEALFSKAPMFEGVEENPISQSYFTTRGGMFAGTTSGKGKRRESVSGSIVNITERFKVGSNEYRSNQFARFDTSRKVLIESRTSYMNNKGERVDIQVRRISLAQAQKALQQSGG